MSFKNYIEEIKKIPTASLSDALNQMGLNGTLNVTFHPALEGVRIAGPAVTLLDFYSTRRVIPIEAIEAIDNAEKGSVLVRVIEGGEAQDIALFGGLMSLASKVRGLEGAIICGAIRDIREIREMNFQVFYRFLSPNTSIGRTEVKAVNVPVKYGGVTINPGDIVVGDDDGVVVIPKDKVIEVLERARQIDELERREAEELRRGKPFSQIIREYARV
ncbi:MAG: RraA family protein [Candidatus Bathyarchaeota archaeon]|nr:RraA family protein [Candidatus Bathyarchaeota archaeon]